jgi:3-oxoadipate enol-lactonase
MKQVRAMAAHDVSARLHELSPIPTLVLSATHDLIAPPSQGRCLAEAIGDDARYLEIEDAAHGLPLTHVERTNALLREHLDGVEARSSA